MLCSINNAKQGLGLKSILCTDSRDFLIKNDGDQVKLEDQLKDKVVGVYFSAHWCPPCRNFTPKFCGIYKEINDSHDNKFEVVFVSADDSEDSFRRYFRKMPWLAVPFSNSAARDRLNEQFNVEGIPRLVVLDGLTGNIILDDAIEVVEEYGAEAYPFSHEKISQLESQRPRRLRQDDDDDDDDDEMIDLDILDKGSFDQINRRLDELTSKLDNYMVKSDEQINQVRAEVKNYHEAVVNNIEQNNRLREEMRNFFVKFPPPPPPPPQ